MLFLLCLSVASSIDAGLSALKERNLRMFFTGYPHIYVGLEEKKKQILAMSKYMIPPEIKLNTSVKLTPSGNKFFIDIGNKKICRSAENVKVCENGQPWVFSPLSFGYSVSIDNKCMTKLDDDEIKLKTCTNTDDQIFSVKLANLDDSCGKLKSVLDGSPPPKTKDTNINIYTPHHGHHNRKRRHSRDNHTVGVYRINVHKKRHHHHRPDDDSSSDSSSSGTAHASSSDRSSFDLDNDQSFSESENSNVNINRDANLFDEYYRKHIHTSTL